MSHGSLAARKPSPARDERFLATMKPSASADMTSSTTDAASSRTTVVLSRTNARLLAAMIGPSASDAPSFASIEFRFKLDEARQHQTAVRPCLPA